MSKEQVTHKNIEIKARIRDYDTTVANVQDISQSHGEEINQEDTFFNIPNGRLKLRKRQDYSVSELIFYDRPDVTGPKLSVYHKCKIQNGAELLTVLSASLGVKGVVRKRRQLFIIDNVRIHLDIVEGLGKFLEIEVMINTHLTPEEGQEIAQSYMKTLGIEPTDLLDRAYIDMLNQPPSNMHFGDV